ncbi:MAG TPA: DUF4166 domain-containing protein [Candidatus Acidoferrum sp.]|nr:DUF4166 domain-containing protein [Candidatus Acidoferrum sp.]
MCGERRVARERRLTAQIVCGTAPIRILGRETMLEQSGGNNAAALQQCFRIAVDVHNSVWGPLFGYRGSFNVEWRKVTAGEVPSHILPQRQERRD